jgi:hypothetical protein
MYGKLYGQTDFVQVSRGSFEPNRYASLKAALASLAHHDYYGRFVEQERL